jgi:CubicO group peptidase (beta-lactamase class C family)
MIRWLVFIALISFLPSHAQTYDVQKSLRGFDVFAQKVMKDWNIPGMGVGIVIKDKLVFAKGYGFRDIDNKLPITTKTVFPIASNTKLFTAIAAGMLVTDGKLEWDKPIRAFDPTIEFCNESLNNSVTLRDMLSHRTGLGRRDYIWFGSNLSRKEMFSRIKYIDPQYPLRSTYFYNNMMYIAAGQVMENVVGESWEEIVSKRIFTPLGMTQSTFSTDDMQHQNNFAISYYVKNGALFKWPAEPNTISNAGPCGSILSSIEDMSYWLTALLNKGSYNGKQVIPESVISETLQPAMHIDNASLEKNGYKEIFNTVYGLGRLITSYRGYYYTSHSGNLGGFKSNVVLLPYENIGVVVFVNGEQGSPVIRIIANNIVERLLDLSLTPWNERFLAEDAATRQANKEATDSTQRKGTAPSHPLKEFAGEYEHPLYGPLKIMLRSDTLEFYFNNFRLPLDHYHYNHFASEDHDFYGRWGLIFQINPKGMIDQVTLLPLNTTFTRRRTTSEVK